jgi:two-component system NtrC family sensor kinase
MIWHQNCCIKNSIVTVVCRQRLSFDDGRPDYTGRIVVIKLFQHDEWSYAEMGARGLKTKIAINITLSLLIGMFSINLVTMMTAQRNLIRAEISKGQTISRVLSDHLLLNLFAEDGSAPFAKAKLSETLDEAGVECFLLLGGNPQQISFGVKRCTPQDELVDITQQAFVRGQGSVNFMGSTFGFFWWQKKQLVISAPLQANGAVLAAYSIVLPLEGIYQSLRSSQQILFLYIFLNTATLAFLGIYRVFKLYLQPLSRLAQRAEDYKEDDGIIFAVRKEDNELQRLSTALNSLLRRLSAEKEKLRATVASLETANTELKKAQTEIIRAEKLASVGRLSAGIAHEIGNPIGIVTGYLELLKPDLPVGERVEYLDRAQKEIERISTIIHQLLEISRPSHGGPQTVSVHALLDDMAQVLKVQPFMSHVRFTMALDATQEKIVVDPNQLRQVFLNLIINAADAIASKETGSRGELIVTTENSHGELPAAESGRTWLHVCFRDNGPGITEENLPNVFDPFFTTKEPGKGTGLGLSVSFMIVESVGGRMQVESKIGQGTAMTVSLPVMVGDCSGR